MKKQNIRSMTVLAAAAMLLPATLPTRAGADALPPRWRISAMGGGIVYEGDEPVRNAALGTLGVGYDLSPRWTLEGVLEYSPTLKHSYRRDWESGERISRLSENAGRDLEETSAVRFSVDGLLHLAPTHRLDPYLAAGIGVVTYAHDFDQRYEPVTRIGAGLFAHLTACWALRLDTRLALAGNDTEFNLITTAGLTFRPRAVARYAAAAPAAVDMVKMFELHLNFAPGKWDLKSEYRSELDVIGRLLDARKGATARIEGHEQADGTVEEQAALSLSTKRAEAVRHYLEESWKIRATRLESSGLGTARPNRDPSRSSERIEVYVSAP